MPFHCVHPATLPEALLYRAAMPEGLLLAGCTDVFPALGPAPLTGPAIDLSGIAAAREIAVGDAEIRIGALATWTEIAGALLPPHLRCLQSAARQIGARQIQNVATIGGNLCNASPAADGVPPLLAVDAEVELSSATGVRRLPLGQFILGNRRTALGGDEILTAVLIPQRSGPAESAFLKLGARSTMVISIVMTAVVLESDGAGQVARAAVAVGACSVVARRLDSLERALCGQPLDAGLSGLVTADHLAPLAPISDVRASADYRRDAAATLIRRSLYDIVERGLR
jgi:CO/xanthine dehydrogenase FAD-binding subunit